MHVVHNAHCLYRNIIYFNIFKREEKWSCCPVNRTVLRILSRGRRGARPSHHRRRMACKAIPWACGFWPEVVYHPINVKLWPVNRRSNYNHGGPWSHGCHLCFENFSVSFPPLHKQIHHLPCKSLKQWIALFDLLPY